MFLNISLTEVAFLDYLDMHKQEEIKKQKDVDETISL